MALEMGLTDNDISILHVYTLECEIYRRVCAPVLDCFPSVPAMPGTTSFL